MEDLKEFGRIEIFVFRGPPLEALMPSIPSQPSKPSWLGRLMWRLRLGKNTIFCI